MGTWSCRSCIGATSCASQSLLFSGTLDKLADVALDSGERVPVFDEVPAGRGFMIGSCTLSGETPVDVLLVSGVSRISRR